MPPRPRSDPSAQTRKRILDTAERLFGERGVAAVSLRDINRAAGISQGVLHYHFGGRDALIEAILQRWLPGVNAERRQMYDAILAAGRTPSERDVVEILCLPLARLATARQPAGRRFLRCLARLGQEENPVWARTTRTQMSGVELHEALQACAPGASPALIEWYFSMMLNVIHGTLSEAGRAARSWHRALAAEPMSPEDQAEALVEFICEGVGGLVRRNQPAAGTPRAQESRPRGRGAARA